jgi:glycerate-2-kinase
MLHAGIGELSGLPLRHVIGIGNTPAARELTGVSWYQAPHPVPDQRSVAAATAAMEIARGATRSDMLLVLMSGGASAMMALPADGLSLDDKKRTSETLLRQGAEVHALNAVRKHLSAIKGGQLAAASGGSVLTLAISDVVGNEPTAIGSGPTVADPTTFNHALDALRQFGGTDAYPVVVIDRLTRGSHREIPETPKPGDPRLARSTTRVIGSSATGVDGARRAAEALGYAVHVYPQPVTGNARDAGAALVRTASALPRSDSPVCLLAAGETTVQVSGRGLGGRNQECALGMARGLNAWDGAAVGASVGTDGADGPTDAGGAVVDSTTIARASAAGLDPPEQYLANNDSYRFFDRLGDLVRTGPTGTNVGDIQVILFE